MIADLRDWLEEVDKMGELKKIDGADWDLEVGCITGLNAKRKDSYALLFDSIKGYPSGFRVITGSLGTPSRVALAFNLSTTYSSAELMEALRQKLVIAESNLTKFPTEVVKTGPVLENVHSGDDIDLFKFPAPKWHEQDGGRYIGTGCAVVTRDPDTGKINLGTYRIRPR